ncbi:MAG: mechanosensitive ion channel family protein [Candidatus Altiarchaeota archaeon]|nr:mechanosensitive ion channel family protein [Candidatus Altiarchaeota archaeon]
MSWIELGTGLVVLIVGLILSKWLQRVMRNQLRKRMPEGMANNTARLGYYALVFMALISGFMTAGLDVSGLMVAGGMVGVAVGFASKTTVSNLISGLFLYLSRPIYIGDPVEIGGVAGVVQDIAPFATRIETWDGSVANIPNDKVFSSVIKNYRDVAKTKMKYNIKIKHTNNPDKAIEAIRNLLKIEHFLLKKPEAAVYFSRITKDYLQLSIRAWSSASKDYPLKQELLKRITKELKKNKFKLL